jgi:amino acid transporter
MLTSAVEQQVVAERGLKRTVGLLGLMWASEGSIIGSGWLFGALFALELAGPGAILAWGIAAIIIIILALVHAELGGMFAVTGGTSRYPHYAYGSVAGATFGWFSYLQAAAVAPIEAVAAVTYMSTTDWGGFMYTGTNGHLTGKGFWISVGLMIVFTVLNMVGIRWWARANNAITSWKVLIPLLAIIVVLATHFHGSNFSKDGGFWFGSTHGTIPKSIMRAIPGAGIVFALLGFEQAVQIAGESRNPQRDLPRAVIGSVLIGAFIYILLQFAFIAALSPATIAHAHTWGGLAKTTLLSGGPWYTVAKVATLSWLAWLLRLDSVISPSGTGLVYMTSTSRISYGLSRNGYIPVIFEKVTQKTKIPVFALIIGFVFGLLFLIPTHSWHTLATEITSASVLMYAGAPLALGALRKSKPELRRPYLLPMGGVMAPLAFVLANFIVYWAGWKTYTLIMAGLIIGLILIGLSYVLKLNPRQPRLDWAAAVWVFPWLIGLGIIEFFGNYGTGGVLGGVGPMSTVWIGADGRIPLWWDLVIVAAWSLFIYYMAISRRLDTARVDEYVGTVQVGEVTPHGVTMPASES